jgi:glucokinase
MIEKTIAFDLGGTNTRAAIVGGDGSIENRVSIPTPRHRSAADFLDDVAEVALNLKDKADVKCIGFGVAAVVDSRKNRLLSSPNISQLNEIDLVSDLKERTGLDVFLENDATAATIGEHWLGAGRGSEQMICITLGTGVGGGLVFEGKPYYGADGSAGEIGHVCVDIDGHPCGCGSHGCLEQYSSGTALVRITKELLPKFPGSNLHSRFEFEPKDVFEAGIAGDEAAIAAFRTMGVYLGVAVAGLVNLLNPEVIVITGGVAAGWALFIPSTKDEMFKRAFQQPAESVKIVRGTLKDDAGVLGAAKRAFTCKGFS